MKSAEHAKNVVERGFTAMEGLFSDAEVAALRERLEGVYEAVGRPAPYAPSIEPIDSGLLRYGIGLMFVGTPPSDPSLPGAFIRREIVDVCRAVLGDDMRIELSGALISDTTRPFLQWHSHIGGTDRTAIYMASGNWPRFAAPERIVALIYLDDIEPGTGEVLVYPRHAADRTDPPYPLESEWPDEHVCNFRRGSVLLMNQTTYHAARPQTRAGLRLLLSAVFASAATPPPPWTDHTLPIAAKTSPLIRSLLK